MSLNQYFQISDEDPYIEYEELFDPILTDRKARRRRTPKPVHNPKVPDQQILEEIADEISWETQFQTTYQPSQHEAEWLLNSLRPFFDQSLITDVLSIVKGGKEASVYCCIAHPSMEVDWLAAKVYRPRKFRGLTNDQVYREGRDILTSEGHIIHENKDRIIRAIGKKSAFGQQVSHTSWLMHEYKALEKLYQAGANVPRPYMVGTNAILMSFIGAEILAAPMLNTIRLEKIEAESLFEIVLKNVELMLQHNLIHADLSAYNILYLNGEITIIDLPQVVDSNRNRNAPAILARDIQRVCDYFQAQGVSCEPTSIFRDLWQRYMHVPRHILRADESRLALYYPDVFGDG